MNKQQPRRQNTYYKLTQLNSNLKPPLPGQAGGNLPFIAIFALSYPKVREFLAENLAQQVKNIRNRCDNCRGRHWSNRNWNAGRRKTKSPFIYVRPEPKKHGRQNQIEGHAPEGKPIVVIEDLISTGKSSLNAVAAIKEQHYEVLGMLALFSYGLALQKKILLKRTFHYIH